MNIIEKFELELTEAEREVYLDIRTLLLHIVNNVPEGSEIYRIAHETFTNLSNLNNYIKE